MRHLWMLRTVVAASAMLSLAAPVNAAVLLCSSGPGIDLTVDQCTATGNDNVANVEAAIASATGNDVILALYGKSDDSPILFDFAPNADPSLGPYTDWTVLDGTLIKYVTIKSGTGFKLFELSGNGASSGSGFSTEGLLVGRGNQPDISHLSFWTVPTAPVPEPGTWALMILGFGFVGSALRRRRRQAVALSFA